MRCPYCGENLGDWPWAHTVECTNTDSTSSVTEIYEYFDCECPECGKIYRMKTKYEYVSCEVYRKEDE